MYLLSISAMRLSTFERPAPDVFGNSEPRGSTMLAIFEDGFVEAGMVGEHGAVRKPRVQEIELLIARKMAVAELRHRAAVDVVVVAPFPHEVARTRLLEFAVGALACRQDLILHGEIPAHGLAVLLPGPVAGECRLGKGGEQWPVRLAGKHAVGELETADIGFGILRQTVRGAPGRHLFGRRIVARSLDGAQLARRQLGRELPISLGERRRAVEAVQHLQEGLVASCQILPDAPGRNGTRQPAIREILAASSMRLLRCFMRL